MKPFLISLFAPIVFILPGSLTATTYYVNPGERIQDAIDGSTNGDTIIVRAGTYTGVGNRDLDFGGKAITLESESGADVTIIDCQGTQLDPHRGFNFHSGEGASSVVEGFTITNGYAVGSFPDYLGGGVYCDSSSPTITNCVISGNSAGLGGGMACWSNSSATITNCTITGNSAGSAGGGIYCEAYSSPTITNCTISGNSASFGGGIFCGSSSPTISNCTITGNSAGSNGGGLAFDGGSPTITNCTISANSTGGGGGGIDCLESSLTITNCILWDDTAKGLPNEIFVSRGTTPTVTYSDVEGGYTGTGNINLDPLLTPDGHLTVNSPCIDWCPTGPADDIDGEARPVDIAGGANDYDIGWDEFLDSDGDGMPDWWELLHFGSTTAAGSGVDEEPDGLTNLEEYGKGTDPHDDDTDDDGRNDSQEIADGTNPLHPDNPEKTYYVNDAAGHDDYDGLAALWDGTHGPKLTIQAGIDATSTGWSYSVLVADGTYTDSGNKDLDFNGKSITVKSENGADNCIIDCQNSGRGFNFHTGEISNSVVDGFTITNGSAVDGGGIFCASSSPTITNCTISGNSADSDGGGIHCRWSSSPTITNCTISGNSAAGHGGGIYCGDNSSPTITNCTISGNSAESGAGGGIHCGDNSSPTITNCTISGNSAEYVSGTTMGEGYGGGISCGNGSPTITNCTISGNSAQYYGGGICCYKLSSPTITNCILWGNAAPNGHEIALFSTIEPSTLTVRYSDGQGGAGEAYVAPGCTLDLDGTNIDQDPEFVADGYWDAGTWVEGDYHLTFGSPCIDTGDNGAANLPAEDLDGYPRIQFGKTSLTVDMGAYEYGSEPFTFTNIERDGTGNIDLTWSSQAQAGITYSVWHSNGPYSDSMQWTTLQTAIPTGGSSTTWTDTSAPTSGERYYKVEDENTGQYTQDTVGLMWTSAGVGRNLVSTPFIPFDTSLDAVIGGQLTGSLNKFFSDNIEWWDPVTLKYKRAWLNTSTGLWEDWDTPAAAPQFGFDPDVGYWINILSFNPATDIAFLGKVSTTGRTIEIGLGRNLCGTAYPVDVSLDDSGLISSGFTGSFNQFFSDNIEWWNRGTLKYDRVWYDAGTLQWKNWDGTPATKTFAPCDGFWINVLSFNTPLTWDYPKPYSEPPNN